MLPLNLSLVSSTATRLLHFRLGLGLKVKFTMIEVSPPVYELFDTSYTKISAEGAVTLTCTY